jgi:hypothetical protein
MMYGIGSPKASGNSPRVISGKSLVHRHLNARQRAAIAADILTGRIILQPSARQLASLLGVCPAYVRLAQQLSSEERQAIASGTDATRFAVLFKSRHALPAPKPAVSDAQLAAAIRAAGIERTLEVAASVEAHA